MTNKEEVLETYTGAWADKRMGGWYIDGCPAWLRSASGPSRSAAEAWRKAATEMAKRRNK